MIICFKCAVEMLCRKTGVSADFGDGHCYAGDSFRCPKCGNETVRCNNKPHHDPSHIHHDEYLLMHTAGSDCQCLACAQTRETLSRLATEQHGSESGTDQPGEFNEDGPDEQELNERSLLLKADRDNDNERQNKD